MNDFILKNCYTDEKELAYVKIDDSGCVVEADEATGVKCAITWMIDDVPQMGWSWKSAPESDLWVDRKHGAILMDDDLMEALELEIGGYSFECEPAENFRAYDLNYSRSCANGQDANGWTKWNGRKLEIGENYTLDGGEEESWRFEPVSCAAFDQMSEDLQEIGIYTEAPRSFIAANAGAIAEAIEEKLQQWEENHIGTALILVRGLPTMSRNEYRYFEADYPSNLQDGEDPAQIAKILEAEYMQAHNLNMGHEFFAYARLEILLDDEEEEELPIGDAYSWSVYSGNDEAGQMEALQEALQELVPAINEVMQERLELEAAEEKFFGALA